MDDTTNQAVLAIIDRTIGKEGGYSNNPVDKGGETIWGITQVTARANGYWGDMKSMPRDIAVQIYLTQYWSKPGFDRVYALDQPLAIRMFDWGVNSGPARAATALQRSLNVLNQQAKDFPDIKADGAIGDITIYALTAFKTKRGSVGITVIREMVKSIQCVFYIETAEKNPSQETFEFGWQLNRVLGE